ncbi:hypothetical protein SCLCIDRAFT_142282 [Scleroderma citrinum Foug A]|uniref:Ubiquitin-like protease family profile domain-containing protein n=1 Tax=Scleroderma citrinum Foug A TaxID=1036808 RepID=A0A0C2ZG96_9AGAM|nr:hypothetical protein SCLCIDRAFT_142282 [Scleroderma citrinum Foug A]
MTLITCLLNIASKKYPGVQVHNHSWIAHPMTTEHLQTNDYNCGLWVLANTAAVLQGHDATGLTGGDMLAFRYYLQSCVLSIPVA